MKRILVLCALVAMCMPLSANGADHGNLTMHLTYPTTAFRLNTPTPATFTVTNTAIFYADDVWASIGPRKYMRGKPAHCRDFRTALVVVDPHKILLGCAFQIGTLRPHHSWSVTITLDFTSRDFPNLKPGHKAAVRLWIESSHGIALRGEYPTLYVTR